MLGVPFDAWRALAVGVGAGAPTNDCRVAGTGPPDGRQWPIPRPPSTGSTAPVMYAAPGEARKVTAAATSSGEANRPRGTAAARSAWRWSPRAAVMSVVTGPGATTLAV